MNKNIILAIDAGNTRTKWGLFDETNTLQVHGAVLNSEIGSDQAWRDCHWHLCKKAVVSNVAGAEIGAQLQALFDSHGLDTHWVKSAATACELMNGYQPPETLGSDRWLAMIAAWHIAQTPCVVVNAGTALTVDAVSLVDDNKDNQAKFLGGVIIPGLQMMQIGLSQNTAGIRANQGTFTNFPQNTSDAVHTGAISAMSGAVFAMIKNLQNHQSDVTQHENSSSSNQPAKKHRQFNINRCIITGGDANILAEVLRAKCEFACEFIVIENLVLQGLLLIERNAV